VENERLREVLARYSRLLFERGYVTAKNGNVSARTGRRGVLITPSSSSLGFVKRGDIVHVDIDGKKKAGRRNPSLELPFHLAAYRSRPDVKAVVHAHPPFLTAFSLVGRAPASTLLPEFVVSVGALEFLPYETPGSAALAEMVAGAAARANAIVLANHGAITVGRSLEEAYMRMEDLEHTARVEWLAERLGVIAPIPEGKIAILREFSKGRVGE
jgi:L-fuculose-phosphate aldolase